MPRNSAGVYSLPEAPFVSNTPISSSATNSNNSDIADAMTDSLSRNGQGGMNALLGLALSGFSYTSDPDTGMSRSAANTQVITVGGSNWTFTTTDVTSPTGTSLQSLVGEIRMWAFLTAPTGWIFMRGQACTTAYPLWRAALIADGNRYGTSGGDPLFPDMRCVVPAGYDPPPSRGLLTGADVIGAELGVQSRTLLTGNLPAYTPSGDVPAVALASGVTSQFGTTVIAPPGGGTPVTVMVPNASGGSTLSVTGTVDPVFNGTAQGGAATAFGIVQSTLILNFIGRAA